MVEQGVAERIASVIQTELDEVNAMTSADVLRSKHLFAGTYVDYLREKYGLEHRDANEVNDKVRPAIIVKARALGIDDSKEIEG